MTEDDDGPVDENRNGDDGPVDERQDAAGGDQGEEHRSDDPWEEAFSQDANAGEASRHGAPADAGFPVNRRELVIGGGVAGALLLGGAVGFNALSGGQAGPGSPTTPTPTVGYGGTTTETAAGAVGTDDPGDQTATEAPTDAPTGTPVGEEYGSGVGYGEGMYGGSAP